jgi:TRAP-type C4-dicarboxylate transport system permease large subunit
MVRVIEVGLVTPPIGMNAYVLSGATGMPLGIIFKGVVPFLAADILHIALLIAFPALSLFLPGLM